MKSSLFVLSLMLSSLFVPIPTFAQVGGGGDTGGQHQYPDLYSGDIFVQSNPNADGQAYIDRSDLEDYPTIVFNSYADFVESISFEEQNWEAYFPLGVNLAFLSFDATENEIYFEKFVFEPASTQFLFESQATATIHALANPNSPSFFGLFQDADKPVKPPIGHIYVIWIDANDNGDRDPGEDTYVGSSTKVEDRFLVHDQNGMLDNPKGKIKVYPVTIEGTVTPNDEGEIDNDDDPNTGGGDGPTDDGEGDFDPGSNGGGVTSGGPTVREVLEYWEEKKLREVIDDNQDPEDERDPGDVPVGDVPVVKNKRHVVSPERMADDFNGVDPPGSGVGGEVPFTYKKVPSFQGTLGDPGDGGSGTGGAGN